MSDSIYMQCRMAALALLDNPDLRVASSQAPGGVFTELDVIMLAARESETGRWQKDIMKVAQREASQAMGQLFRNRKVVRFGPVNVPGLDDPDYMRINTKIAYARPDGPVEIKTPNGVFGRMFIHDDGMKRQGRRLGADRDDLTPWKDQDLTTVPASPTTADQREHRRLRAENAALRRQNEELHAEIARLREHNAQVITKQDLEDLRDSIETSTTRKRRVA